MSVIGIDYTPAYEQGGGIGRYVRELVAALASTDEDTFYKLFVAGTTYSRLPATPGDNFAWCPTRLTPQWLARLWQRARIPYVVESWTGDIALFHATDFVLPPVRKATRSIVTVHDLSFVFVPETASPGLKAYLDRVVPRSVQRANVVLADSQATKEDLVTLYHVQPEKVIVLLSGVDIHFQRVEDLAQRQSIRARYRLGDWPFLFTVGTVQPRKNYVRLCQALAKLRLRFSDLHLVIAGGKGWLEGPIYRAVADLNLQDYVHFIGFAQDADLPILYSMAEATPYVSLYEGFGFPALEAMACGTPVVASNVSSIPEVVGDAALLVDPTSVGEIVDAIQTLLMYPALKDRYVQQGYRQAKQFTWAHSAQQLRQIYQQVLEH